MMPRLNGLQAVAKMKNFVASQNFNRAEKIEEPVFVFLTAYKTSSFDRFVQELEVMNVFEKPLTLDQLQSIFSV